MNSHPFISDSVICISISVVSIGHSLDKCVSAQLIGLGIPAQLAVRYLLAGVSRLGSKMTRFSPRFTD